MPNIKSSSKRVKIGEARNARNKARKTAMRTDIKKFDVAATNGATEANDLHKAAVKSIDRAASKGILHKNTAARQKSKMAKKMNAIAQ